LVTPTHNEFADALNKHSAQPVDTSLDTEQGMRRALIALADGAEKDQDRIRALSDLSRLCGFDKQGIKDLRGISNEELLERLKSASDILRFFGMELDLEHIKNERCMAVASNNARREKKAERTFTKTMKDNCRRCYQEKPMKDKERLLCEKCFNYLKNENKLYKWPMIRSPDGLVLDPEPPKIT